MAAGSYSQYSEYTPPAPEDPDVRNIIDKLAVFVARNGVEFEQMTMDKQRDNPKFNFLFGGESHAYYKWRVGQEQASLYGQHSQQQGMQQIPSLMSQQPQSQPYGAPPSSQAPSYGQQQQHPQAHQGQGSYPPSGFSQSQQGSWGPPPVSGSGGQQPQPLIPHPLGRSQSPPQPPWIQKQQAQSLELQLKQTKAMEQSSLQQHGISNPLEMEFTDVVRPIMESCRKDAIAAGKSWIFNNAVTMDDCRQVSRFIMRKTLTTPGVNFTQKLHIIYLINDVIHHCLRKGAQELKQAIEENVVQMFYNVYSSDPQNADSLLKVLKIWETQHYFSETALQRIRTILSEDAGANESANQMSSTQGPGQPLPPWQQQSQQQAPPPPSGAPPTSGGHGMYDYPSRSNMPPLLPWQQQQQTPPPWQQRDQQRFGGPPPPWGQSSSSQGAPPPWVQQQPHHPGAKPMPLFPPSHSHHHEKEEPPPPPPSQPHHEHSRFGGHDGERDQGLYRDDRHDDRDGRDREGPPYQRSDREAMDVGGEREREGQKTSMERVETEPRPSSRFESFEYNHQSHPSMGGGGERESQPQVFDYHHQSNPPPPWSMDSRHGPPPPRPIPIPPPGFGPPRRFPPMEPKWGPPPPHGPPGPPGPRGPPGPPDGPHGPPRIPPPDLPPPIPYFDLPAGITCLLVPLHEDGYRPLNPDHVRIPPPQPPTDRLLKAVEEFYLEETEDTPRNQEGWEARALLGFYESKRRAKENMSSRFRRRPPPRRRRSRSRSDSHSPRYRRSRRSRSYSPARRSYSRSRSRSYSRSRSRSPGRKRRSSRSPSSDSRSRSRSRSASRSHSPRRRRRSRSRSRSPFLPTVRSPKRSPPPFQPSFMTFEKPLEDTNVGHQMLKKMGWEGAGLGAEEQGIQEPIKGGEVRDKVDKYKGVGMDLKDPFEMFRKNKSYTYNRRERSGR